MLEALQFTIPRVQVKPAPGAEDLPTDSVAAPITINDLPDQVDLSEAAVHRMQSKSSDMAQLNTMIGDIATANNTAKNVVLAMMANPGQASDTQASNMSSDAASSLLD